MKIDYKLEALRIATALRPADGRGYGASIAQSPGRPAQSAAQVVADSKVIHEFLVPTQKRARK